MKTINVTRTLDFIRDKDLDAKSKLTCLCLDTLEYDQNSKDFSKEERTAYRMLFLECFVELLNQHCNKWNVTKYEVGYVAEYEESFRVHNITEAFTNERLSLSLHYWTLMVGSIMLDVTPDEMDTPDFDNIQNNAILEINEHAEVYYNHAVALSLGPVECHFFENVQDVHSGWSLSCSPSELHFFSYRLLNEFTISSIDVLSCGLEGAESDEILCEHLGYYFDPVSMYRKLRSELSPSDSMDELIKMIYKIIKQQAQANSDVANSLNQLNYGI